MVYRTDTNAPGFGWLSERSAKSSCPKNFLEINRYFALTSYCNTIGQSNNAFSILGSPCFVLFIYWLIKQITNTYRDNFSRTYENRSIYMFTFQNGVWRGEMNIYSNMSGTHGVDKAPFCAHAVTILGTSSRAECEVKSEN